LSNGKKKDISIFIWKQNSDTGEWEKVPFDFTPDFKSWVTVDSQKITPDEFWTNHVQYKNSAYEQWRNWQEEYIYYDDTILDAIDMVVDDMNSYPEARMIINYIRNNLGAKDED